MVAEMFVDAEPYRPFPLAVLPEPLKSFVSNTAAAIGCDAAMLAVPVLVGAAAAVGTTRRLQIKAGWVEPSVLWGMIVSRRGSKKSPALKRALRPAYQTQALLRSSGADEPDCADCDPDGDDSCRQVCRSVPGHLQRVMTSDVSIAGLAGILDCEPRGILAVRDELTGWLGDLRKKAGRADASHWLSAWSAEAWIIDRHGRDPINIPAAAVSVVGGIQPDVLRKAIGATDLASGLFDRFLFAVPPSPPPDSWTDVAEDPEDNRMMDILFGQLYGLSGPSEMTLDGQARKRFVEFFNANGQAVATADEAEAALLSKFPSQVARIAMVLQLTKWAVGDASADAVDSASMASAIELGAWFASQGRRALALLDGGPSAARPSDEEVLFGYLGQIGSPATVRDLQRKGGRRFTSDQIAYLLASLLADGRVREVPDARTGPGPKTPRYELTG